MDKRKLVKIIVNDLEELKILSEEAANSKDNSSLVIDLALNKARLLIQEIELLRELAGNSESEHEKPEEDSFIEEEEDFSNSSFPDPELEIINFEEGEFPESAEFANEEVPKDEENEIEEEDEVIEEDEEDEESQEDDLDEEDSEDESETEPEDLTEELEEDDLEEAEVDSIDEDDDLTLEEDEDDDFQDEEADLEEDDEDEESEKIVEKVAQGKNSIHITELKNEPQPGIREIHIDDQDDDFDIEPVHFSPSTSSSTRPVMREIPKPENPLVGESFQKERSLNDSIGENKSMESKLTNSPITNLRAAIGLNDRFIFIREIFDNNTEKYNTVIEQLDKFETIQQAVEYLKANLSMEKNEASLKFVDLLKRRFTK